METYSLERSFRAFSINDASSAAGSSPENNAPSTLELNSHLSLPYQWEQFLDLKTGEVYYIDWRSGRKSKGDPRRLQNSRRGEGDRGTDYEAGEQEEEADEGDDVEEEKEGDEEYEGGESENGSCSSSCSSTEDYLEERSIQHDDVLVVAGCKRCLMYFMLPKITDECPKCSSLLLHFNGSESTLL
ncbi:protein CURLY FLAG LEAF 1 [Nymphaea colorata]|nr:protein CURLY FLAG LEAF 1 [Nymphaea colorata]